jgi:NAD(P)-dependent dehydrogenase (short-subunit alcohol dehydrogenase family)
MALAFARAGADVEIASRKREACEATAREIEALGRRALAHPCHVGDWDALGDLAERAWTHFGRIDVLVNNAGMSPLYSSLAEVGEALWDKVLAVNLKGPFRLSALLGARMAAAGGGATTSVATRRIAASTVSSSCGADRPRRTRRPARRMRRPRPSKPRSRRTIPGSRRPRSTRGRA